LLWVAHGPLGSIGVRGWEFSIIGCLVGVLKPSLTITRIITIWSTRIIALLVIGTGIIRFRTCSCKGDIVGVIFVGKSWRLIGIGSIVGV